MTNIETTETFDERLRRIVRDISLGMNCQVRLGVSPEGRRFVQIQCYRMDVITKEMGTGYGGKSFPSEHASDSEIVQMIFGLYKGYWEHEARESFEWRGRRPFGPHISTEALWSVARQVDIRSARHVEDRTMPVDTTTRTYMKGSRPRVIIKGWEEQEVYLKRINSKTAYFCGPYFVGELAVDASEVIEIQEVGA